MVERQFETAGCYYCCKSECFNTDEQDAPYHVSVSFLSNSTITKYWYTESNIIPVLTEVV